MGLLEALLALVGFAAVVVVCAAGLSAWYDARQGSPEVGAEADPYTDGLAASARVSAMAFEAAQAMHHAAEQAIREE